MHGQTVATAENAQSSVRASAARLGPYLAFVVIAAFLGAFLVWPIVHTLSVGFGLPGSGAKLQVTLTYLVGVFRSHELRASLLNSIAIAVLVTLLAAAISIPLALISRNCDFRGKTLTTAMLLVPLVLPPFVGAIGLRQIFGASGALTALTWSLGLVARGTPVSWLSEHRFLAVVIVEAFSLYPILFLNVVTALSNLDPALEQAATNLGAGAWRTFRSITLPLLRPGLFAGGAIVFIWSFGELGTPLIFDLYDVAPVQIFLHITETKDNPIPYAVVIIMLLISAAVYVAGRLAIGQTTTVDSTKASFTSTVTVLTGVRAVGVALLFWGVIAVALLPHVAVVLTSLSKTGEWYRSILPRVFTLQQYAHALSHEMVLPAVRNSLLFSVLSVVLCITVGTAIAFLVMRPKLPRVLLTLLDTVSVLPLAVPGLVLAFGYYAISLQLKVWFASQPRLLSYVDVQSNPTLLLVLAYTVRRLPYVVRGVVAGLQQAPLELELAARNIGASTATTVRRITLPQIGPNLIAAALLVFAFTMLEVSDSLILAQKQSYWPVTRAIFELYQGLGDGPYIASALGAWAMLLLVLVIVFVNSLLGKRLGALFRV